MAAVFYPVLVRELDPEDGGGFIAVVLDLRGCSGEGDSPEAALGNAREAALEWVDEAQRLGRRIPEPSVAPRTMVAPSVAAISGLEDWLDAEGLSARPC